MITKQIVKRILKNYLGQIVEDNNLKGDQIYTYLKESAYSDLPFTVKAMIKKNTFYEYIKQNPVLVGREIRQYQSTLTRINTKR